MYRQNLNYMWADFKIVGLYRNVLKNVGRSLNLMNEQQQSGRRWILTHSQRGPKRSLPLFRMPNSSTLYYNYLINYSPFNKFYKTRNWRRNYLINDNYNLLYCNKWRSIITTNVFICFLREYLLTRTWNTLIQAILCNNNSIISIRFINIVYRNRNITNFVFWLSSPPPSPAPDCYCAYRLIYI